MQNLISRYEYDIWESYIDWNLFVIAGGSVISSLLVNVYIDNSSDIDLFFLKENYGSFEKAVVRF